MSNAPDRLASWVLERSATEPAALRAQILRDTAETIAGGAAAQRLVALANEIESAEAHQKQLLIDFRGRAKPESDHRHDGTSDGKDGAL
jgi:hypothetical protein